jgi:hypothetical protein
MNRSLRPIATLCAMFAIVGGVCAFALLGPKWNTASVVMQLQLGSSGGPLLDGSVSWNESAETALALWNRHIKDTQFFVVRNSTAPIGDGDGANNVFFSSDVYGRSFNGAIAITTVWTRRGVRTEGDVVFNSAKSWNSYRGPLRPAAGGGTLLDLQRVALHEFGHVLGLDHPDEFGQRVRAIMNSRTSDLDSLQSDDIEGAQFLYGRRSGGDSLKSAVTVKRPPSSQISTNVSRYLVSGTADTDRNIRAIRIQRIKPNGNDRWFTASGIAKWNARIPLAIGTNIVRIYAVNKNGNLVRIRSARITRL